MLELSEKTMHDLQVLRDCCRLELPQIVAVLTHLAVDDNNVRRRFRQMAAAVKSATSA